MKTVYTVVRHAITDVIIMAVITDVEIRIREIRVGKAAKLHPLNNKIRNAHYLSETAQRIRNYLDGKVTDLSAVPVDLSGCTSFQKKVLETVRCIPYGTCVSYSELAETAGCKRAVRAVASVMRRNRLPLIIPCHRVIRNDGSSGAYCGEAEGEDALLKTRLIAFERQVKKKNPSQSGRDLLLE